MSKEIAVVDLGSNSFHLLVAREEQGQAKIVDRVRERVALAVGLQPDGTLTHEAQARGLACLERLGQRIRGIPHERVRAVGTNTFRKARNAQAFIAACEERLGHHIEIVSGQEEARLIYGGVASTSESSDCRRLVVDIGGGSTELVIGEGSMPLKTASLFMGCIGFTDRYFSDGKLKANGFEEAEMAAKQELEPLSLEFMNFGWQEALGSSGTNTSVAQILAANGWGERGITLKGLNRLTKAIVDAGQVGRLNFSGMPPDRGPILPGGVAILKAVFESLKIDRMTPSNGALREGVLADLLERIRHEDVRDQTIRRFMERYEVDSPQASRLTRTVWNLLDQAGKWVDPGEGNRKFLKWAANLHESGLSISYTGYHKHSAYIVANSDMPGFSKEDQKVLAALVRAHRRKLTKDFFKDLPGSLTERTFRLALLLRLAVCLHRSRTPEPAPTLVLTLSPSRATLSLERTWLADHPLAVADLAEEADRWKEIGMTLDIQNRE